MIHINISTSANGAEEAKNLPVSRFEYRDQSDRQAYIILNNLEKDYIAYMQGITNTMISLGEQ